MYSYIYDIFTSDKKYEKQLLKIEGVLTDLGISGKIYKLNVLRNLDDVVDEILSSDSKNIVAVGNDQTLSKIANLVIGKNIALGIIPFGEQNILANSLGIKSADEACQILSARNIAKLDVGKINGNYFLLSVETNNKDVVLDFKNYNIHPLPGNEIVGVYNINIENLDFKSNPCDGTMEVVFRPGEPSWWQKLSGAGEIERSGISVFPIKKLTIKHKKKPIPINIDKQLVLKTPLEIEVVSKKLRVIVGKERVFD